MQALCGIPSGTALALHNLGKPQARPHGALSAAGPCCRRHRQPALPGQQLPRSILRLPPCSHPQSSTASWRQQGRSARLACHAGSRRDGNGGSGVPVRFKIKQEVEWGECLRLVGSHPSLGNWKVRKGAEMGWKDGHVWSVEVALPAGSEVEYKCVKVKGEHDGDADWEPGYNRTLRVPSGATALSVEVEWGEAEAEVEIEGAGQLGAAPTNTNGASLGGSRGGSSGSGSGWESDREEVDALAAALYSTAGTASSGSGSSFDDSMALLPQWQGKELRFMRSNEHTRERQGVWDTSGLQGPALHLVAGDRDAANWLGKLEVVKKLLVDSAPELRPRLDALAHAYIYMQWLATGAIPCVEGGGHHRPNRHAELARLMFRSLEWVIGEQANESPVVPIIGRRLQSRLPSFTEQFTQSVPLTRIRDIAHRNDIPKDLKAEIKHTLQNKLHRNAGPEDLHTTEAMLARITANPGEYNSSFVDEFRTFTAELRDFFNAGSLTDMLGGVRPAMDEGTAQLIDHFNAAKGRLDAAGEGADQNAIMDVLHATTTVRAVLVSGLSSGLRNDAPDRAIAMRQKWRQCEVRAEDYAFVLLSRFINSVEGRGGAPAIAAGSDGGWALPIGCLVLSLRHIGLSGYNPKECMAIEHELAAWQQAGGFFEADNALRLKATLQRLRRLTESYSQLLLDAYAAPAAAMGRALGLETERYLVFTESEIRASLVFQLSKLTSILIKATTIASKGSPWDVLMAGSASGVLLRVPALEPGCLDAAGGKDAVLLVDSATGDEEVSALGSNLRGIILKHDLPHLSHLGVRARQEGVPFVTCEDHDTIAAAVLPLMGSRVQLHASAEGVDISPAGSGAASFSANGSSSSSSNGASSNGAGKGGAKPAAVKKVRSVKAVPLDQATLATAGAKAAACGELLRLAASCQQAASEAASATKSNGNSNGTAIMAAADGVVLPFGCMEAAVNSAGQKERLADLLKQLAVVLGSMQPGSGGSSGSLAALDGLCGDIQGLLGGLQLPQQALQSISGAFKPGGVVIARSSANVEDLAGMSGAGLYESIPNVDSSDYGALQSAITGVWASLFSRRAVLSRHAAGVPQEAACMAVVVQRQLSPDLCFVLHTRHPVTGDDGVLSAELAPGLGETLAAGTRGSPWRLEADKAAGTVSASAFANFSQALLPPGSAAAVAYNGNGAVYAAPTSAGVSGGGGGAAVAERAAPGGVQLQVVDYSQQPLSVSADSRTGVGRRLLAVAALLEHEFGLAQDVEGCFVGNDLFVVQTRPQP